MTGCSRRFERAAFQLSYFGSHEGQLAITVSSLTRAEIITQSEEQEGEGDSENSWYGATSRHGHSKFGS